MLYLDKAYQTNFRVVAFLRFFYLKLESTTGFITLVNQQSLAHDSITSGSTEAILTEWPQPIGKAILAG